MYAIHPLPHHDFHAVTRLFVENFPKIDDNDFANAWSSIDLCSSMGLYYNATLVGFGLVSDGAVAFLTIDKAHRGGGNGTRLLQAIQATCDELTLKPVNCTQVISWYKRHGFVISRVFPFIHEDIPTCEMMWRAPIVTNSCSTTYSSRSTTRTSSVESICISEASDEITPTVGEILAVVDAVRRGTGEI